MASSSFANDVRLIISCAHFWVCFIALLLLAAEVLNIGMIALILVASPILTFLLIRKYSVPSPEEAIVNEVLGKWMEGTDEATDSAAGSSDSDLPTISVWAHRFAALDAPENTLEALDLCIQNGAKAVEFDLILTADLVPVIFHDARLDRMTNLAADIRQLPWSKVKTLDVSQNHPFSTKYPNARIPLFEDVIKKCCAHKLHMVIDIKDDRPELVDVVVATFSKYPELQKLALVSGLNPYVIWSIRRAIPEMVCGLTWRPLYLSHSKYSPDPSLCIPHPYSPPIFYAMRLMDVFHKYVFNNFCRSLIGFSVVLLEKDNITRGDIIRWKKQNVRVMAWTVNVPIEKQMFIKHLGVPIITDSMLGSSVPVQ